MTAHGLTVEEIPRGRTAGANEAKDKQVIARRGPFAAIADAPTLAGATRRASLVLGMHRWGKGHAPARPCDVLAALGTWRLLNTPRKATP